MTFNEQAAAYARLDRKNKRIQRYAEAHKERVTKAKLELLDRAEEEHIGGVRIKGLANITFPEPTWYATMQDRTAFQKWAKENRPALLRVTEAEKLMNELVREYHRDGREFPPGVTGYPRRTVSVKKA